MARELDRGAIDDQAAVVVAASLLSFGSASVVNDSTHPIRVETKTQAGEMVPGADCKLSNDYGSSSMKSGDTVQVRRSGKDLDVVCSQVGQTDARARAVSRANAGMLGNIILGGGIGAIIDHDKGTAYTKTCRNRGLTPIPPIPRFKNRGLTPVSR